MYQCMLIETKTYLNDPFWQHLQFYCSSRPFRFGWAWSLSVFSKIVTTFLAESPSYMRWFLPCCFLSLCLHMSKIMALNTLNTQTSLYVSYIFIKTVKIKESILKEYFQNGNSRNILSHLSVLVFVHLFTLFTLLLSRILICNQVLLAYFFFFFLQSW